MEDTLRFPVTLPNGQTYRIGGCPLCSPEKLARIAPELAAATLKEADTNDDLEEQAFQIVKFFNPDIDRDSFLIDLYAYRRIQEIWIGNGEPEKKTGD